MLCEHCHKKIVTKRHLWNLFSKEIHHLCEVCYQRYPLLPSYEVIPIESGEMHLFTMISKSYPVEPHCYQSFYQGYYDLFMKRFKENILLIFDSISESLMQDLDHLSFGNLMVVRLYENSHDKGEKL